MLTQNTEHVPSYSIPLDKEMTRDSGGANNMHPLSWGVQTEKIQRHKREFKFFFKHRFLSLRKN